MAGRAGTGDAPTRRVEPGGDPVRARGLAVGPRDADQPQLARGTAVDQVRERAEPRLQLLDRQVRELPRAVPHEAARIPQNGAGAATDRLADERASVALRPRIRG